jgi:hypothetical protein
MPITLTPAAGGVKYYASQSHTFTATGLNGGVDFPANSFVALLFYSHSGSGDLIAPKIGGQAATNVYGFTLNSDALISVYTLQVGGSSVVDSFGSDNGDYYADLCFRAYILTGGTNPTPIIGGAIVANSTPSPVTVPAGGVGLVALGCDSTMPNGTTVVWTPPPVGAPSDAFFRTDGIGLFATYSTSAAGAWATSFVGTPSLDFKGNRTATLAFQPTTAPIVTIKGGTANMMGV